MRPQYTCSPSKVLGLQGLKRSVYLAGPGVTLAVTTTGNLDFALTCTGPPVPLVVPTFPDFPFPGVARLGFSPGAARSLVVPFRLRLRLITTRLRLIVTCLGLSFSRSRCLCFSLGSSLCLSSSIRLGFGFLFRLGLRLRFSLCFSLLLLLLFHLTNRWGLRGVLRLLIDRVTPRQP